MNLRDSMQSVIGNLLDGKLSPDAAVGHLAAIDVDALLPSQLAGAVEAVMERAVPFPAFPDAIDCCGTGGDGQHTFNISTAAALVAAACGVTIAKHGNRAVTSRSGSADVLQALGVKTDLQPAQSEILLRDTGITFLFAPTFHPGFANVAAARKTIGRRTIFNLLGPLCNPARVKRQLIGVFAPHHCALVAETAQLLGHAHVMAVHGDDGADEFSITGPTHVAELNHGHVSYVAVRPQDAGLKIQSAVALKGGTASENAEALRGVLKGIKGPYADAVVLNTAAVLVLAGKAGKLYDGVLMARNAIALGKAARKLDDLIEASHNV